MYMLHEYKGRNIWAKRCWGKIAMKDLDKNKNKAWGKKYCMYSTLLIVEECMLKICSWDCLWIPKLKSAFEKTSQKGIFNSIQYN